MFKLAILLVVGAAAVDTAPVISLDLATVHQCSASGSETCATREHTPASPVRQSTTTNAAHFADECALSTTANPTTCTLPNVKAYDHHEGDISDDVKSTMSLFVTSAKCASAADADASPSLCTPIETATNATAAFTAGTFHKVRGMYVVSYDVKDVSGNDADQVKFAVIIRDQVAPTTTFTEFEQVLQQGVGFGTQAGNTDIGSYEDDYDTYVEQPADQFPTDNCAAASSNDVTVHDYASIFGKDYANNVVTKTYSWTVVDTIAPVVVADTLNEAACFTNTYSFTTVDTDNTDIECVGGADAYAVAASHDSSDTDGAESAYQFTDAGDDCRGNTPTLTLVGPLTNSATVAYTSQHESTIALSVTAKDRQTTPLTSIASTHTFTIRDTSPPLIESASFTDHTALDKTSAVGTTLIAGTDAAVVDNAVGTTGGGNRHGQSRNSDGELVGSDTASATNLFEVSGSIIQHSAGYTADYQQIANLESAFTCTDTCGDATGVTGWHKVTTVTTCDSITVAGSTAQTALTSQVDAAFNIVEVGTYILKYTCTDVADLVSTECKTVYNIDHTRPVLNVIAVTETAACTSWRALSQNPNSDGTCVESHPDANYVDAGATCSDVVDNVISELVEVSGQVVDLNSPGTYTINYACSDTAGNSAVAMQRTVYVIDATCPTCFLNGCFVTANSDTLNRDCTMTQEASFPYTDEGAVCEDRMGVNITHAITYGSTGEVDVEETGTYVITYKATDSANNNNIDMLSNDEVTCSEYKRQTGAAHAAGSGYDDLTIPAQRRTVVVVDSMRPVITLQDNMMEETTSSSNNGWVIAALGSAVAGIALLSLSARKNVVTNVPV